MDYCLKKKKASQCLHLKNIQIFIIRETMTEIHFRDKVYVCKILILSCEIKKRGYTWVSAERYNVQWRECINDLFSGFFSYIERMCCD